VPFSDTQTFTSPSSFPNTLSYKHNLLSLYFFADGRALLSRQFVEMPRLRIEGLLALFPKLIEGENAGSSSTGASGGSSGPNKAGASGTSASTRQHTFIETDQVRYLYIPLEALYLCLITNKGSNIVEDLSTLRLLSKTVVEQLGQGVPISDESVSSRAFELIFAFDEVLSSGGYVEDGITLHQIRTNLEMESHEEKLAQMIKASKMAEAKEAAKKRANEIRERTKEEDRLTRAGLGGEKGRMSGFGSSNSPGGGGSYDSYGSSSGGRGGGDDYVSPRASSSSSNNNNESSSDSAAPAKKSGASGAGMKLGSKKSAIGAGAGALAGLIAEEGIKDREADEALSGGVAKSAMAAVQAARAAAEAASADQATVLVEEKVTARISRDGGVVGYEVKGSLALTLHDENASKVKVLLKRGSDSAFSYQSHPNINKAALGAPGGQGAIAAKQADRGFPTGTSLSLLRWRFTAKDDDSSQLPIMLTCWPEETGGGLITVNVEYTLQHEGITLNDLIVSIPLGSSTDVPKVLNCDGQFKHNAKESVLAWRVEAVDQDSKTGSMEFTIKASRGVSVDSFFPVKVSFASNETLVGIEVLDVVYADDGKSLRNTKSVSMSVEEYVVE
jgi:hypothetical protein